MDDEYEIRMFSPDGYIVEVREKDIRKLQKKGYKLIKKLLNNSLKSSLENEKNTLQYLIDKYNFTTIPLREDPIEDYILDNLIIEYQDLPGRAGISGLSGFDGYTSKEEMIGEFEDNISTLINITIYFDYEDEKLFDIEKEKIIKRLNILKNEYYFTEDWKLKGKEIVSSIDVENISLNELIEKIYQITNSFDPKNFVSISDYDIGRQSSIWLKMHEEPEKIKYPGFIGKDEDIDITWIALYEIIGEKILTFTVENPEDDIVEYRNGFIDETIKKELEDFMNKNEIKFFLFISGHKTDLSWQWYLFEIDKNGKLYNKELLKMAESIVDSISKGRKLKREYLNDKHIPKNWYVKEIETKYPIEMD